MKLSTRNQILVYTVFGILFGSGFFWWIFHEFFIQRVDFQVFYHPFEKPMLKVHGFAAMASLVVMGMLIPVHMRLAWAAKKNRLSGISFVIFLSSLALTGYGLYYAGGESLRHWIHEYHEIAGLLFPLVMGAHVFLGIRSRGK